FPTQRGEARARCLRTIRELESALTKRSLRLRIDVLSKERKAQLALDASFRAQNRPSVEEKELIRLSNTHNCDDRLHLFDPKLHFADVIEEGGFDVIIGNPPWGQL